MSKKALIVTISEYAIPANNLEGVQVDAAHFTKILATYGISDIEVIRNRNATSATIKTALAQLLDGSADGDVRVFYFSGHGTRLPDGEAIVPYECSYSSLIVDKWLAEFLRLKVPSGVMFWGFYDCCYSGDMFKRIALSGTGNGEDSQPKEVALRDLRFDDPPMRVAVSGSEKKELILGQDITTSVHVAAARPTEQSLCMTIDGKKQSVFTWALAKVLETAPLLQVGDLETALVAKVAQMTAVHVPRVCCGDEDRTRMLFT